MAEILKPSIAKEITGHKHWKAAVDTIKALNASYKLLDKETDKRYDIKIVEVSKKHFNGRSYAIHDLIQDLNVKLEAFSKYAEGELYVHTNGFPPALADDKNKLTTIKAQTLKDPAKATMYGYVENSEGWTQAYEYGKVSEVSLKGVSNIFSKLQTVHELIGNMKFPKLEDVNMKALGEFAKDTDKLLSSLATRKAR